MRARPLVLLTLGTLAIGASGPLIALAMQAEDATGTAPDALAIAAWRTVAGGVLFLAVAAVGSRGLVAPFRELSPRAGWGLLGGTVLLALHFATWISAFAYTSFASAVLLMVLQPVFGVLLDRVLHGHQVTARKAIALVGATVGLALLVAEDLGRPGDLHGDLLAAVGAFSMAAFYVAVTPARPALPFSLFMGTAQFGAGLLLTAAALLAGSELVGFSDAGWGWIVALVLIPTGVGHACFNWALSQVRLFVLNLLIVLEPAIAIAIGIVWLGEAPGPLQWLGGAVLGGAVLVGVGRERRRSGESTSPEE